MSAFLCSDYHIATMAKYIAALHGSIDAQMLASKLKAINIASLNHRYNDKQRMVKCKTDKCMEIGANDFTALFDCWDYQACENQHSLDYQIMHGFLKFYADKGNRTFSNIQWSI